MATTEIELHEPRRLDARGPLDRLASRLPGPLGRWTASVTVQTVVLTLIVATGLQLLWLLLLANNGGDLAAQDFWAAAAHSYPGSAYNFAWYGGLHVASYSVGSPYLMAVIGVRATLIIANIAVAGLSALVLARSGVVRRPWIPSMFAALAMLGNAISGRATFALGLAFAIGALAVVYSWPQTWSGHGRRQLVPRAALAAFLAVLATAGSPVAGFFLGLVAGGLWLTADHLPAGTSLTERVRTALRSLFARRRLASYALGLPPVAVVVLSAVIFPFSGRQPMSWTSIILPLITSVIVVMVVPVSWRTVRATAVINAISVVALWIVPTQIGSNVVRFALLFGGVVVAAALSSGVARNPFARLPGQLRTSPAPLFAVLAMIVAVSWQGGLAALNAVHTWPAAAMTTDQEPIIAQLEARHANLTRVEVVPSASHAEAATLAPYFALARGWNRQADVERNPLFYNQSQKLTAQAYRTWLARWAVGFVVVPPGTPDAGAQAESALIHHGLPYLHKVWSDTSWTLYAVKDPTPMVASPGRLTELDEAHMTIHAQHAGAIEIRIVYSPWLGLVNAQGALIPAPTVRQDGRHIDNELGCVEPIQVPVPGARVSMGQRPPVDTWTILRAPHAGNYTLAAPYSPNPGTPCPQPKLPTTPTPSLPTPTSPTALH